MTVGVRFDEVSKTFDDGTVAVDGFTLDIADGEFLVLVGPSGSGKSTVLRMLAGLEEVTAGSISIDGRDVTDEEPRRRDIAMVFQNYALYPHMDVRRNLGFGLKLHRVPKPDAERRVLEGAEMLSVQHLLHKRPRHLSGGQRQRVAMGRAVVREPRVFLMDEPLSNLDAKLRVEMRASISRLHQRLGTTTLYVTHDQTEAMTMGHRVAVMRDGRLEQVDGPRALYERPTNLFVAAFIGSPAMNLVRSRLVAEDGRVFAELGRGRLAVPAPLLGAQVRERVGESVVLGIRPESLEDAAFAAGRNGDESFEARVSLAEPMGAEVVAHFDLDGVRGVDGGPPPDLVARLDPRTSVESGSVLRLAVDVERLHFFDAETGAALER